MPIRSLLDHGAEAYGPILEANSDDLVGIVVHSAIIPEPEEYALVFGLFALGFVILRRHFQKKRQQASATS